MYKLNVGERLVIPFLLPKEGNRAEFKIIEGLKLKVGFSADELDKYGIKNLSWEKDFEKDFEFEPREIILIEDELKKLNREKKLTPDHLSLYDKFIKTED